MPDRHQVLDLIERWRCAELSGNPDELRELFADGFIGIGPMGWVRTKAQWVEKYRSGTVSNDRFDLADVQIVALGASAALVVAHQSQTGTNGTAVTAGQFRFSLTVSDDNHIHSIHVTRIIAPH